MVLVLAKAVAVAVRVIVCDAPGATLNDAGAAVTPAGIPERATATGELKPLMAVTVTVICWVAPPAVKAIVAGVADREKSPGALDCFVQLVTLQATQIRVSSPWLRMRRLELLLKFRPSTCIAVLLPLRRTLSRATFESHRSCDVRCISSHRNTQTFPEELQQYATGGVGRVT
jgi:hypothetical protein